jgi:hypothetical protein|tara:strand:+ start:6987 stop:7301 length:315 start_codon:yes stop_codon:yes gene_type:complete
MTPILAKIKVVKALIKHAPPRDAPHGFVSAHVPKCEDANNTAQIPNESIGWIENEVSIGLADVRINPPRPLVMKAVTPLRDADGIVAEKSFSDSKERFFFTEIA